MTLAMVFGSGSPLIVSKTRAFFLAGRQFAAEENPKPRYLDKLYNDLKYIREPNCNLI